MLDSIASPPAVLAFHDVSATYGSRQALSHVTAAFPPGAVGLLGANGAGKSTIFRVALGLLKPAAGRVDLLGLDIARSPEDVRARIGYVPECDAFIPSLNAIASVAYCGELAGLWPDDALQRAHDVLSFVGLGESRYRDVEAFSTGMKQRLKLAQALVHDPDLLLLDEPTSGLDPKGRDDMLHLISALGRRHHVNLIFSSHILADIERTCDAVVVLDRGTVAGTIRPADWASFATHAYTVRVKGDRMTFMDRLRVDGVACEADDEGLITVTVQHSDDLQRVFAVAQQLGVQIRHLRADSPTLEDLFLRITRPPGHNRY